MTCTRKGQRQPRALSDLAARVFVLLGEFVRALAGTMRR